MRSLWCLPVRPLALTVLLLGSFTLACAGQDYSLTGYTADVGTWVGEDANTLVRVWGPPASTFTMPNRDTVYVYVDAMDIPTDKHLECSYNSKTQKEECTSSGGETIRLGCSTSFEVGPDQRVAFTRAEGTLCIGAKMPPASGLVASPVPPRTANPADSLPTASSPSAVAPSPAASVDELPVDPGETPLEKRKARRVRTRP